MASVWIRQANKKLSIVYECNGTYCSFHQLYAGLTGKSVRCAVFHHPKKKLKYTQPISGFSLNAATMKAYASPTQSASSFFFFAAHKFTKYSRSDVPTVCVCVVVFRLENVPRWIRLWYLSRVLGANCLHASIDRIFSISLVSFFFRRNAFICWTQWKGLFSWRLLIESSFSLDAVRQSRPRPLSSQNNGTGECRGRSASIC